MHRRHFAERAFAIAGPMLRNALPLNVRDIETLQALRRLLEKHFFNIAFKD